MMIQELLLLFLMLFFDALADHLWKSVVVSKNMLGPFSIYFVYPLNHLESTREPKVTCGSSCDRVDWCNLWCYDDANGTCLKSNAVVSPLHVALSNDIYHCYSHQEPDYVVGAIASVNAFSANRPPSNLVNGIYNFNDQSTCSIAVGPNPWTLVELRTPQTIHEIRITTQYYNIYDPDLPHGAEIKVSLSPPSEYGIFSNFDHFGTLPNPATILTTYSFKNQNGMKARYISIQKTNYGNMLICQIMAL